MNVNPYESPRSTPDRDESRSSRSPLIVALALFLVGIVMALLSIVSMGGGHGSYWFVALTSAPVYLAMDLIPVGDVVWVVIYTIGTGLLYVAYARLLAVRPFWRGALIVLAIHGGGVLAMVLRGL